MNIDFKSLGITVLILALTVSIGANIGNTIYDSVRNETTYACNNASSTNECIQPEAANVAYAGTEALGDFSDWLPIIVITGIGAGILIFLRMYDQ